jgi:hypothetical protein
MPQLGNMKFPYTPAGKQRYQQIKKQIGQKVTRPAGMVKPRPIGPARVKQGIKNARRPIDAGFKRVQPINKIRQVERASSRSGMAAQMDRLKSKRPF